MDLPDEYRKKEVKDYQGNDGQITRSLPKGKTLFVMAYIGLAIL